MKPDDPDKREFASWESYQNFAEGVLRSRRYIWEPEVLAFLNTVLATANGRNIKISKGHKLYRAQQGIEVIEEDNDGRLHPVAYGPERMKPLKNRGREGRANPTGIPVLYLATTMQTAISEIRPWIGSEISVARFRIVRDLKAVDLSRQHGRFSLEYIMLDGTKLEEPNAEDREKAVWTDIDNAFSRPVTRTDAALGYVPTQILAELFRDAGYDALVYKSQFGEGGYNVVLFGLDDAVATNGVPCKVTKIDVQFEPTGSAWASEDTE